ncbi:MAG: hypothetical protein IJ480_01335 [Clostridia bacterium]|nr:hypothetical protein [Clostridia bacterium]
MKIRDIQREKRGFCLTTVRFEEEPVNSRRGRKQAQTMNRFYEALENSAEQYAEACLGACVLSRYVCVIRAGAEADDIVVTVSLTHRIPGEASRRKTCLHRWRDGLLLEEKMI